MTNRLEQAVGLGEVIEPVLRGTQAWPTSGSVMGGVGEAKADGQGGEPQEASERGERQDRADERHVTGATSIGMLGRLRKNGTRRVRITNTTRVWVASDSTNQPLRNSLWLACRTCSITKKIREVEDRADGAEHAHEPPHEAMSQAAGRASGRQAPGQ